jgi:Mg-chelatase subunit ChlD
MKTDFSKLPREEVEARITTMLMGEMPEAEAAELREYVAADPALARLEEDLRKTILFVEEADGSVTEEKLSTDRRGKLLRQFKVIQPVEMARSRRRNELRPLLAVAAMLVALLGAAGMLLPSLAKSKYKARVALGLDLQPSATRGRGLNEREEATATDESLSERPANTPASVAQTSIEAKVAGGAASYPYTLRYFSGDGSKNRGDAGGLPPAKIELPGVTEAAPKLVQEQETVLTGGADKLSRGETWNLQTGRNARGFGGVGGSASVGKDLVDTFGFDIQAPDPRAATGLPPEAPRAAALSLLTDESPGKQAEAKAPAQQSSLGVRFAHNGNEPPQDSFFAAQPGLQTSDKEAAQKSAETQLRRSFGRNEAVVGAKPASKVTGRGDAFDQNRIEASQNVQDARSLIEKGKLEEAEASLKQVVKNDPENRAASYYLDILHEQRYATEARKREISMKDRLATVEKSWNVPLGREALPDPSKKIELLAEVDRKKADLDLAQRKPASSPSIPQPEVATAENPFSTFSLNVSDVSFKLAQASLEKGQMPDAGAVRSEEFINAFDYHDPVPTAAPVGFVWERARYPFAQDRDLIRLSVKTAASGREAGRPLNLVLLLDSSGSMERADRVQILRECLRTLAGQLRPEDRVSVVAFARTARLWVDGLPGSQAKELVERVGNLTPEGGTNLEEAMRVAYETARKHFLAGGVNRVVLLTDGAANLGDVQPESLKRKVEAERRQGVALDCFGIGWEGLNDELLERLSRNGDGRYGFVNSPEAAATEFSAQLAGALHVAAADVKVQVEFNPKRVTAYRQIGYAKHQLTKEQFRDNTVDAAELGAAEAGNALYVVQVNAAGEGPLGTVRVRFKVPGTNDYREHEWPLTYQGASKALENSTYTMRLAGTAAAFSEWLTSSPFASEVTTDRLLNLMAGVPENFPNDPRPKQLVSMIRQAKSLSGK